MMARSSSLRRPSHSPLSRGPAFVLNSGICLTVSFVPVAQGHAHTYRRVRTLLAARLQQAAAPESHSAMATRRTEVTCSTYWRALRWMQIELCAGADVKPLAKRGKRGSGSAIGSSKAELGS